MRISQRDAPAAYAVFIGPSAIGNRQLERFRDHGRGKIGVAQVLRHEPLDARGQIGAPARAAHNSLLKRKYARKCPSRERARRERSSWFMRPMPMLFALPMALYVLPFKYVPIFGVIAF